MKKTTQPIVYNATHYTVMANDIIKGKQSMSLQEARIIRLMVTQIAKDDKDLKTYTCNIQDLAAFLGVAGNNLYRDIASICSGLVQQAVHISTGNPRMPWETFPWIQLAKYDGAGTITLMLSNQIQPYVMELDKYFTQYRLENILQMSSFYAIRLYELIKCDDYKAEDYREYSIEFLRQYFDCEKKYPAFDNFRRRVLEPAICEINKKSDLEVGYVEYKRSHRRIVGMKFAVLDKEPGTFPA